MADGIRLGGAYYELTADDANLVRTLARSQTQAKTFSEGIAKSMGTAATATDQSMKRMAASTQQASTGFTSMAKGAAAFGIAAVGIQSAASVVNQAIGGIVESTKAAQQAQFALGKTYGATAPQMAAFSKQFGDEIGRSTSEVMQAAVVVGNLTKEYGLNQAQARQLIRISADLAAVYGKDLPDATQRLQAAIRGEAEAAEALGLVLNDEAVAIRQLGKEHKDLWEHLTDAEKAQLRLAEATKQLAEGQGAAQERAEGLLGNFDRLTKATNELGASLGTKLLPPVAAVAGALANLATNTTRVLDAMSNLSALDLSQLLRIASVLGAIASGPTGIVAAITAGLLPPGTFGPARPGDTGRGVDTGRVHGPTLDEADAGAKAAADKAAIIARARRIKELEDADKANKAATESAIKAIDAERKAKEQWYDEEKSRIEARRHYQLEDIETRKDAAIKALQEEKQATLDAIDEQIEQQERLKESRLAAAEAAADAARAAITAQKEQLDLERELADRAREDEREAEDRAAAALRRSEDRARADNRRAEDREIHERQEEEIRQLEALTEAREKAVEAGIAALERATDKRIRALDREAERARQNGEDALTRLERQGEAEEEAHRVRMQALDDEQDARLEALDVQLEALDADEKRAALATRMADLQKRLTESQLAASRARGTGTPEQIAEARKELTAALRTGNELSIENARERLLQLAGQGNKAIQEADEQLAEAQQAIRDAGVDEARDAEREKLEAAQEAIKKEIDARKRSEEDSERGRKRELELLQEHERAQLAATLDRLAKRKQAVTDSSAAEKRDLQEQVEADRKAQQEQIRLTRERFEADGVVLRDRREAEDRLREDERQAQDQFRADERQAQDRAREDERQAQDADLARQLAAINVALATERAATEAHYNGPNGVVTQLKRAREASEREYSARLAAVTASYEAERKAAELKYRNPEKNGELDLLETQRAAEMKALADRKTEYEETAKAHHEMIQSILKDLDEWIKKGGQVPTLPGAGGGGGGGGGSGSSGGGGSSGAGLTENGNVPEQTVLKAINRAFGFSNQAAADAVQVWSGEGRGPGNYVGDQGTSFGPFQLHMGGGLGNAFQKETGLDPRDPSTVEEQIAWVAQYVRENGWNNQWHGAPGYNRANPSKSTGISVRRYALGGLISEPVLGMGVRSGQPYAIGEYGPEYVIGRRATSALGLGPGSASGGLGGWLAGAHPGGVGGGSVITNITANNVNGSAEVARAIAREQRRLQMLRGV